MFEGSGGYSLPAGFRAFISDGTSESDSLLRLEDDQCVACLDVHRGSVFEQRRGLFNEVGRVSAEDSEIEQANVFLFIEELLDAVSSEKVDLDVGLEEALQQLTGRFIFRNLFIDAFVNLT